MRVQTRRAALSSAALCATVLMLGALAGSASAAVSFSGPTNLAAGTNPSSGAVGDFNGDTKTDLAVANFNSNNVSIRLGNGDGTFGAQTTYSAGNKPYSIKVGDFNGDLKLDLSVVNNQFSGTVSILLGNGDGTFGAPTAYAAGINPVWVALGDYNGDTKTDLAVANYSSNNVSIRLGNGDGTFGAQTTYAAGSAPNAVAVGDFNGDTKTDLAVANQFSDDVSVLLGNGDGTFAAQTTYAAGDYPIVVAAADFNGDTKPDLAITNAFVDTVSIRLGNGDGTFAARTAYPTGDFPTDVVVDDFDGDSKTDLAVANAHSDNISILRGNGDGTFAAHTTFAAGDNPSSVAVSDLNSDSKPDLAAPNFLSDDVSILLNTTPTASTTLACPENLLGFAREGVTVQLSGPCVSTVGATVDYDLYHPGTAPHVNGTPHYPAPGLLSTLAAPTNGSFGFPSPGVATYTPTGAAGTTDSWQYAATDDGGATWTTFDVDIQIVTATQTVFETPPVSPTVPLSASVETTGTTGVSIAGRAPTTAQPPGFGFLGHEWFIEAPDQTVATPLRITVTVAASVMSGPPAVPTPLQIFRNGSLVPECSPHDGTATPDPCWESKGFVSGPGSDYRFVVLTSQASVWNVAAPDPYPFEGFFAPVDNPPVVNEAKGGSAIPVKFSLGGDEGLSILAEGYPKSEKIDCSSGDQLDAIESTVTAGDSSLQYDPLSQVYTYVWKTSKNWAATCRRLDVKLTDGTTHSATFRFKK